MNPIIESLLLQIVAAALRVTSQGQWHVFVDLAGHVSRVDIRIYPAGRNYSANDKPAAELLQHTYYEPDRYLGCAGYDEELQERIATLHSMLAQLLTYLQPPAQQQEAAA